jgi:hypothetical protein
MRIFQALEVTVEKDEIVWAVVDDRFVLSEECRGYALWLVHSGRAVNIQKAYQLRLARFLSWCAETETAWAGLRFHQLAAYDGPRGCGTASMRAGALRRTTAGGATLARIGGAGGCSCTRSRSVGYERPQPTRQPPAVAVSGAAMALPTAWRAA